MHGPIRGRENVKKIMTEFRAAFPDLNCWALGISLPKAAMR
jgi:hypothetical protein